MVHLAGGPELGTWGGYVQAQVVVGVFVCSAEYGLFCEVHGACYSYK